MTTATATAIHGEYAKNAAPPTERVSRISSGAYATGDSASEANTGNAMRLGSSWWCIRSDRKGWPMSSRFSREVGLATTVKRTAGTHGRPAHPGAGTPAEVPAWHAIPE